MTSRRNHLVCSDSKINSESQWWGEALNQYSENAVNIEKNFKQKIKPILDRQVYAVTQTIVSGMFSGVNPQDISFRNVLNRLMILIQQAVTFVVVNDETEKEHYRSNKHPADIENINKRVQESAQKSEVEEKWRRFNIFGSHYSLLVLMYFHDPKNRDFRVIQPNKKGAVIRTESDLIAYSIEKILSESTYNDYSEGVLNGLRKSVERCRNESIAERKQKHEVANEDVLSEVGKKINTMLLQNRNLIFSGLREYGYLDHVFNKVKTNLHELMKFQYINEESSKTYPANYILFVRDFGRRRDSRGNIIKRHDEYEYNIRIMLCDSQRKDISNYFRDVLTSTDIGKYSDGIRLAYTADDKDAWVVPLAENADAWLSQLLSERSEENLEEIIRVLEAPFGDTSRSAIDPVFDGVVFFRRKFVDGGIKRCFTDAMKKAIVPTSLSEIENGKYFQLLQDSYPDCVKYFKEEDFSKSLADDLKRLAITYYLYNGMAGIGNHSSQDTEISILITPFEIGGKIWACAGYFTLLKRSKNEEKKEVNIKDLSEIFWLNYHIYLDVDVRLRRDLRLSLIECYYDILAFYYAQCFQDENMTQIASLCESNSNFDWGAACKYWIEQRYIAITAYLPYESIKIYFHDQEYGLRKEHDDNKAIPIYLTDTSNGKRYPINKRKNNADKPDVKVGVFLTKKRGAVIGKGQNSFFEDVTAGTLRARESSRSFGLSDESNAEHADGEKSVVNMRDLEIRLTGAILRAYTGLKPTQTEGDDN